MDFSKLFFSTKFYKFIFTFYQLKIFLPKVNLECVLNITFSQIVVFHSPELLHVKLLLKFELPVVGC